MRASTNGVFVTETERALALIEEAFEEIAALNHGKKWQMRVPVDPSDSDEVISAALLAAKEAKDA